MGCRAFTDSFYARIARSCALGDWGLGFEVWGLGIGVCGLGFGVWGLGVGGWVIGQCFLARPHRAVMLFFFFFITLKPGVE